MALTRSMLKGMGLTEEQVGAIIDAHTETVDGLKEALKTAKADAEKLPAVQKELDELKAQGDGGYKEKFEKERSDFEAYKKTVADKEALAQRRDLYRKLLKEAGVDEKFIDIAIAASADTISKASVEDGKLKGAEELEKEAKTRFASMIGKTETHGAQVQTPPANEGGSGANPRAAEIARAYQERRYGAQTNGGNES